MTTYQHELMRGWAIHQKKQLADAEQIYRRVLTQAPQDANAWCYLGMCLHDQRRYDLAIDAYQQALHLQPNFPVVLNNLGNSLRYVGQFEQADQSFQKAIDLKPNYLNAYKNRGTLHVWNGSLELGLNYYEQALKINPHEAELHRNVGVIYLLQGRFAEGWKEYRWRWQVGDLHRPYLDIPVWEGTDLSRKSILLTAEQGLGDTLQFVRMAQVLREQGAKTLVYAQAPLITLLQNCPHLGPVFPNNLPLNQRFDFQCSLMDVADRLNVDHSNIPSMPGYLRSAAQLGDYWRARLPNPQRRFRVGIAWQGNPDHQADMFRSVRLKYFEPLSHVPHVELICLQQGVGTEQLSQWKGAPILLPGEQVDKSSGAFMDTAAILSQLDLVVTTDTSIAHLAGAMGVPTWIALGYVPDWRWMLGRDDSPWYPSVTLYRQPVMGDWNSVFEQMRLALSNR